MCIPMDCKYSCLNDRYAKVAPLLFFLYLHPLLFSSSFTSIPSTSPLPLPPSPPLPLFLPPSPLLLLFLYLHPLLFSSSPYPLSLTATTISLSFQPISLLEHLMLLLLLVYISFAAINDPTAPPITVYCQQSARRDNKRAFGHFTAS